MKRKIIIALVIVVALVGVVVKNIIDSNDDIIVESETTLLENSLSNKVLVEIRGAVKYPNIYEVDSEYRVDDIINLAGGLTQEANISEINRLEKVYDSMLIQISENSVSELSSVVTNKISLNTASLQELMTLTGIGEAKALAIISYRNQKKFSNIEEVKNVSGISETIFSKIKDNICI